MVSQPVKVALRWNYLHNFESSLYAPCPMNEVHINACTAQNVRCRFWQAKTGQPDNAQ
jgi:hypothetical protein